jgi:hypothetical protein
MNQDDRPPEFGRRAAGVLALSSIGLGWAPRALAQAGSVVLPVAMPCPARDGDIVGLVLEGTGAPPGSVTVFGQAFRPGDLPRGAGLAARLAQGAALAVQHDVTTRHPDGSALFAVVSLVGPPLSRGQRAGVLLARDAAGLAPAPAIAPLLAGREAVVEITPETGAAWQADLLALLRAALAGGARAWQHGALAVQARVSAAVPPGAVGGATSARLVADIGLRADGALWADVWLRNDIAMRDGGGPIACRLRLRLDGREALDSGPLRQAQYTGWGRLVGAAQGGGPAPVPAFVRHDAAYLADAGAVARHDLTTGVEEAALNRMAAMIRAPDWHVPFNPRGISQRMGTTGNRGDIGPTTLWQAAWLATGDLRAAVFAVGQAEADGAIPWHFWDPGGGADRRGGWLDTERWPGLWTDPRGGRPPRGLAQPIPGDTGWQPDRAHQPDLSFVPYLLTGRRAFLDGLLSQGVWGIISQWPATRAESTGAAAVRDRNIVNRNQVRGAAWSLRTLGNAAWIAPDDDASAPFLRTAAAANWAWLRSQLPAWTARQGEAHGWIPGEYGAAGALPPWQQDFFASTTAAAARRGNADARAVLDWSGNFLAGRFLADAKGFSRHDGAAYLLAISPENAAGAPFNTWGEIGAATRERGFSNGTGWRNSNGYYGRLALQSLAQLIEITGSEPAQQAYAWLVGANAPFTAPPDLARDPTLSIVPRGQPRIPARVRRCS